MAELDDKTIEEVEESPAEEAVESPTDVPEEETPEEESEAPTEDEGAEEVAEETPEEKPPSRRESLRIQQLVTKLKEQSPLAPQVPAALDYATALDADPEVLQQIEAEAKRRQDVAYSDGVKRAESILFHTRLEVDAPRIEAQYSQLDQKSPDFNPALADAINSMYLNQVGWDSTSDTVTNSNLRYADYVESVFELAETIAGEKNTASAKNIAKQAATTGLRPDGSRAKRMNLNQAPEQMTDEELEAVINSAIPK